MLGERTVWRWVPHWVLYWDSCSADHWVHSWVGLWGHKMERYSVARSAPSLDQRWDHWTDYYWECNLVAWTVVTLEYCLEWQWDVSMVHHLAVTSAEMSAEMSAE